MLKIQKKMKLCQYFKSDIKEKIQMYTYYIGLSRICKTTNLGDYCD